MNIEWNQAITIILFMIVHLCGTVWWMSKIQTTLTILATSVERIARQVEQHEAVYMKKEDCAREIAHVDTQIKAIWAKIDKHMDSHK